MWDCSESFLACLCHLAVPGAQLVVLQPVGEKQSGDSELNANQDTASDFSFCLFWLEPTVKGGKKHERQDGRCQQAADHYHCERPLHLGTQASGI